MRDIETPQDVDRLVRAFYKDILESDIAYIFTDVAKIDLDSHLPHIASFWSSVLLGAGSFQGNPMGVHIQLAKKTPLGEKEFKTWLTLFHQHVDEMFAGPIADQAKSRATHIAGLMRYQIEQS